MLLAISYTSHGVLDGLCKCDFTPMNYL